VLQSLGLSDSERYFDVVEALIAKDAAKALKLLTRRSGKEPRWASSSITCWTISVAALDQDGGPRRSGTGSHERRARTIREAGGRLHGGAADHGLELIGESRMRVRGLPHARPMVELALVQLASLPDLVAIGEAWNGWGRCLKPHSNQRPRQWRAKKKV